MKKCDRFDLLLDLGLSVCQSCHCHVKSCRPVVCAQENQWLVACLTVLLHLHRVTPHTYTRARTCPAHRRVLHRSAFLVPDTPDDK